MSLAGRNVAGPAQQWSCEVSCSRGDRSEHLEGDALNDRQCMSAIDEEDDRHDCAESGERPDETSVHAVVISLTGLGWVVVPTWRTLSHMSLTVGSWVAITTAQPISARARKVVMTM